MHSSVMLNGTDKKLTDKKMKKQIEYNGYKITLFPLHKNKSEFINSIVKHRKQHHEKAEKITEWDGYEYIISKMVWEDIEVTVEVDGEYDQNMKSWEGWKFRSLQDFTNAAKQKIDEVTKVHVEAEKIELFYEEGSSQVQVSSRTAEVYCSEFNDNGYYMIFASIEKI
jgi:hypothetical protein